MANTLKLHARVTKEIEVTEEQMERLCNFLCGSTENCDVTDIKEAFLKGVDSGNYEAGYIPQAWIQVDFERLGDDNPIKQYLDENQLNFDDIELY
ncbi:MAG: hypothetical protein J6I68_11360 [Butyrivibrio sp.]|uniref:hypothetical protein n=1 Tax=Butyrivibrio sp. TaxID=28121 RepID=UPI001B52F7B2|nr:hypothetical protein [Butyrivibrio sp.]MBP3783833.1 hypothetical protein [Butyrivibrio sp.]